MSRDRRNVSAEHGLQPQKLGGREAIHTVGQQRESGRRQGQFTAALRRQEWRRRRRSVAAGRRSVRTFQ
jgi:hypothetical protein